MQTDVIGLTEDAGSSTDDVVRDFVVINLAHKKVTLHRDIGLLPVASIVDL